MLTRVLLTALLAAVAAAQTPLSFEVASVKAVPVGQWRESKTFDDRVDFPYVTLKNCIAFAYRLKEYQVSGPPWIGELRYEILAKGPAGTRRDQLPEMMRTLLAERFHLQVRQEKKEFSVYGLIVGKDGPKLTPTPAGSDSTGGAAYGVSMTARGVGRLEAKHADMTSFANTLPRFVGRPVVDFTNLSGRYDFEIEFSPDDTRGMRIDLPVNPNTIEFGASIFTSIQQVGLKLDARKVPLDSVVVEAAEKTPVEN